MAWHLASVQVDELLRAGQPPPQDQATGGKLRGCEDCFKTLRCLVVDVRSADRASGHIKAFQRICGSTCPVSPSLQGSVHEPTSFQAPLLNRAGAPREGARKLQTPHRVGPLVTACEVPELVAKFSKEKLVAGSSGSVLVACDCAAWIPCAKLLRSSTASTPCTADPSGMPSLLSWAMGEGYHASSVDMLLASFNSTAGVRTGIASRRRPRSGGPVSI